MSKGNPDVLQGTLDLLILKTLVRGPQHGYGIACHIQQVSDEVLRITQPGGKIRDVRRGRSAPTSGRSVHAAVSAVKRVEESESLRLLVCWKPCQ